MDEGRGVPAAPARAETKILQITIVFFMGWFVISPAQSTRQLTKREGEAGGSGCSITPFPDPKLCLGVFSQPEGELSLLCHVDFQAA